MINLRPRKSPDTDIDLTPVMDVNPRRLFSCVEIGGFIESRNKDKVQVYDVLTPQRG